MLIDIHIMPATLVPGIILAHAVHTQLVKILGVLVPQADGTTEGMLHPGVAERLEGVTGTFFIGLVGVVGIEDGIGQTAGGAHHRHGAVFHGDDLGQAAGLEGTGDEQHVGAGVDEVGELLVVADLQVYIRVVIELGLEGVEVLVDGRIGA